MFDWKTAKKTKMGVVLGLNVGQIKFSVVKTNKETGSINSFLILYMVDTFKAKGSGCTNT